MGFADHSSELDYVRRKKSVLAAGTPPADAPVKPVACVLPECPSDSTPDSGAAAELEELRRERDQLLYVLDRCRKDPFEWLVNSSVHPPQTLRFLNPPARGLVSAIIPGYKGRQFLQRCFESVWSQNPGPFSLEIVFCDDCCPENTREYACELAAQSNVPVTIVSNPGGLNRGVSATRNLAMAHSSGEFLALLDVDDEWLPKKTETQVGHFRTHPEVEAVCSYADCVDLRNRPAVSWGGGKLAGYFGTHVPFHSFETLLDSDPIMNSTVMMRRTAVQRCGGYTEVMAHQAEDWLLFQKLALRTPIHVIPEALSLYRVHPDSYTASYVKEGYDAGVRWETHLQLLHWLLQDKRYRDVAIRVYRRYTPKLLVSYAAKFRALEESLKRIEQQDAGAAHTSSFFQKIQKWLGTNKQVRTIASPTCEDA
jgi:glycosyltransferase involved in cell wall biosynthesis